MRRPGALAAPLLMLVAAMASIQCGAALAKTLFPLIGPQGTTALRVVLAAAMLAVVWRPWRALPVRRDLVWIGLYGAALGAMNMLFYMAVARIPLGVAVAVEFIGPLAVALAASRRLLDVFWVVLAGAGVTLLLPLPGMADALDLTGLLLALGAGGCWALYIVFGKRAGASGPGQAAALGMTVAALLAAPVGVAHAGADLLSWSVLPIGLAVAALSSAIPYSLEMFALARLPRRTFGISMSIEPALAAMAGLVFLSEQLSLLHLAAIACVIAASCGSAVTAQPDAPGPH